MFPLVVASSDCFWDCKANAINGKSSAPNGVVGRTSETEQQKESQPIKYFSNPHFVCQDKDARLLNAIIPWRIVSGFPRTMQGYNVRRWTTCSPDSVTIVSSFLPNQIKGRSPPST